MLTNSSSENNSFRSSFQPNNAKVDYSFWKNPFLCNLMKRLAGFPIKGNTEYLSPSRLDNFPLPTGFILMVNEQILVLQPNSVQ
jgi:hypothetical protein